MMPITQTQTQFSCLLRSTLLKIFSFALIVAVPFSITKNSYAHDDELADLMKQMDEVFVEIEALVDEKGNVDLIHEQVDTFTFLVDQAKDIIPEDVAKLPEEERKVAIAQYQELMDQLKETAVEIPAHAHHGMWDEALASVNKLKEIQKKAHDQFKHEHEEETEH